MRRFLFLMVTVTLCIYLMPMESFGITVITQPVSTPFGKYTPESQPFTPSVAPYTVPESLQGVLFSDRYVFSDSVKALLVKSGFAAVRANAQSMTSIYKSTNDAALPVFVTTDLMLHCFFKMYDNYLKIAEYNLFYSQLDTLLQGMLNGVKVLRSYPGNDSMKLAISRTAAFLDVAHILLTDSSTFTEPDIREIVAKETLLILQHKGFSFSNVLPELNEDFSQYVPRGHYTIDAKFERYFKAMMYLGRMNFRDTSGIETIQACILTYLLSMGNIGTKKVSEFWATIYNTTSFFSGKSDDLNFKLYATVLDSICGITWRSGNIGVFSTKLNELMIALQKYSKPMILSGVDGTGGFRIMGQRFVPDSYLFGRLVYNYVGTTVNPRLFPRGLDMFAAFGSQRARQHLLNLYHENNFFNYTRQLDTLINEFAAKPPAKWVEDLYWNWLYTLIPLFNIPGKGFPSFMTTPEWTDKSLVTASGSWAELRHANVLYAKQSYSMTVGLPCTYSISIPQGYVEPNPEVFGRLAAMVSFMKSGFDSVGLSSYLPCFKLTSLFNVCKALQAIAIKELEGETITMENYCYIANLYKTIADAEDFRQYQIPLSTTKSKPDTSTVCIVDVHTDPNTGKVLEVGTGKPMCLYVVVPVEGKLQVCRGAMFSYYEFLQPMENRLTDTKWEEMLNTSSPSMPEWTASFTESKVRDRYTVWEEDQTTLVTPSDSIPGVIPPGGSMDAIVYSDTIPSITLDFGDDRHVFSGELVSDRKYRFSIPSEKFHDTTILIISSRTNGAPDPYCGPTPKVTVTYRKVVIREIGAYVANKSKPVSGISIPYFRAGRIVVPPNSAWRVVDGQGRQVAYIKKGSQFWIPPSVKTYKLLFVIPIGGHFSSPTRIVTGLMR